MVGIYLHKQQNITLNKYIRYLTHYGASKFGSTFHVVF